MEKGKKYLLLKEKKRKKVIEVEVLDISESCYKLKFIDQNTEEFNIPMNIEWILKEEFGKKYKVLDEIKNEDILSPLADLIAERRANDEYDYEDHLKEVMSSYHDTSEEEIPKEKTKIAEEIFDVKKIIEYMTTFTSIKLVTTHDIQKRLLDRISDIAKIYNINKVFINTNLGSIIQDFCGITMNTSLTKKDVSKVFPVGNIGKITFYVDPIMKWNDQRIIFKNDEDKEIYVIKVIDSESILIY